MRTTVNIDDKLYKRAVEYLGISSPTKLLNAALESAIQSEAYRRLSLMGGIEKGEMKAAPRKKYGKHDIS